MIGKKSKEQVLNGLAEIQVFSKILSHWSSLSEEVQSSLFATDKKFQFSQQTGQKQSDEESSMFVFIHCWWLEKTRHIYAISSSILLFNGSVIMIHTMYGNYYMHEKPV